MTEHGEARNSVGPHDVDVAVRPVYDADVDSNEMDGEGNGQTTSDAGEQKSSGQVPGADRKQGRVAGVSASVPRDDRVEGEEEFDQPVCIPCPGAPSAKVRADHDNALPAPQVVRMVRPRPCRR